MTTTDDQMQALLEDVQHLKERQAILDKEVQYFKDRQAILDVISRHARGHDRHDLDLMNSCFWDDGFDEHGQWVVPGPDYAALANSLHSGGFHVHQHNITTHNCEIDGETAHCESYCMTAFIPRYTAGQAKFTTGRYIDRFEKRDGEWKIVIRRTVIEVSMDGPSNWPDSPIGGTFPKGSWDTGDLSYARPLQIDSPSPFWDGTTH